MIVIILPLLQRRSHVVERFELMDVQTLVPQPSVERLDHPVLDRLPRSNEIEPNPVLVTPLVEHLRREFRSVIDTYRNRQSVRKPHRLQRLDALARQCEVGGQRDGLPVPFVDDGGLWREGNGSSLLPEAWLGGELRPELDLTEDGKAFQVTIDLPGLDEKDVAVTLSDRELTIRGEKKEEKETKEKDYYRRERTHGTFRRSIELPSAVDAEKIEASFKKGVLTIRLPKTKEAQEKIKQIAVKAA